MSFVTDRPLVSVRLDDAEFFEKFKRAVPGPSMHLSSLIHLRGDPIGRDLRRVLNNYNFFGHGYIYASPGELPRTGEPCVIVKSIRSNEHDFTGIAKIMPKRRNMSLAGTLISARSDYVVIRMGANTTNFKVEFACVNNETGDYYIASARELDPLCRMADIMGIENMGNHQDFFNIFDIWGFGKLEVFEAPPRNLYAKRYNLVRATGAVEGDEKLHIPHHTFQPQIVEILRKKPSGLGFTLDAALNTMVIGHTDEKNYIVPFYLNRE